MFYKVIGLMSGTSLDGLDIAYCTFDINEECKSNTPSIQYNIEKAQTIPYNKEIKDQILRMETCSGEELACFSTYLGHYFGKKTREFIEKNNLQVDFIASHGQTIFHQIDKQFTLQIGDLNAIAAETECSVIGDFRSLDVALGGQGAPLVPIGDEILFYQYDSCLNLGGFSNVSYNSEGKRIAYDICPTNIVLNKLCMELGLAFDNRGRIARENRTNEMLLSKLNNIPHYELDKRTSLGKEFVKEWVFPILDSFEIKTEDKIATYTQHIAQQIAKHLKGKVLVTGGGAYNEFLIDSIRKYLGEKSSLDKKKADLDKQLIIPNHWLIEYKEALIFAFLGVRRVRREVNCLKDVTGARKDSCSGAIVYYSK